MVGRILAVWRVPLMIEAGLLVALLLVWVAKPVWGLWAVPVLVWLLVAVPACVVLKWSLDQLVIVAKWSLLRAWKLVRGPEK